VFGGHHAHKYVNLDGVRVAAVYDHKLHHAERLARPLQATPFDNYEAFLATVDLVTVATPAQSHAALAALALAEGKHVYVEKPLAVDADSAVALVQAARARGLVLACGHQERVVFAAMGLLNLPQRPQALEAVRRGLPSERNRDVSCVLDLMIHDLDLALQLAGGAPVSIQAEGGFDEARAEVAFEGGMVGKFEASRIAVGRERTMRLSFAVGVAEIDFLSPAFRNATPFALVPGFAETAQGRDPLGESVAGFVAAIRGERPRPVVNGEEGATALELALKIQSAIETGSPGRR